MKKVIWSIVLSWVCFAFAIAATGTSESVKACNGKEYRKGDKILFGVPMISGYLFVRTFSENGKISTMPREDLTGKEAVIVDIPEYDKSFFESMGIYSEVETHPLIIVELDGRRLCINLNDALCQGNIVSDYYKSEFGGAMDLTPDILFVYAVKLNNVTVNDDVVVRYMAHCDNGLVEKNQADPFAMAELKKEYAAKLNKALDEVDFKQVFRVESQSEIMQYDMDKQFFPLKGLWCPQVRTDQPNALAKLGFCKWEDCVFRFVNIPEFTNVPCEMTRAKGFYDMRKMGKVPAYNKPLARAYTYIRFLEKKVELPAKKNIVYHDGEMKSLSLNDLYGSMAIEAQIVKMDVYNLPFLKIKDFEVFYNYLGTIEAK